MIDHMYVSILLFAIALLGGLVITGSKMKLWRKLAIIALLSVSGLISYRAIYHFYGYPKVMQKNYKNTLVLGFLPDKANNVIYLWLKESNEEPRSYSVPFNHELNKSLHAARKKHKGKPFKANINVKTKLGAAYKNTVKETKMEEVIVFPPKR